VYPYVGIIFAAMTESLFQYVLSELQRTKGRWDDVAEKSGVSKRTIEKIANGEIADPRVTKIERLAAYFRANPRRSSRSELRI
jgi:transcriptional regulator with XRE-family HTH domain